MTRMNGRYTCPQAKRASIVHMLILSNCNPYMQHNPYQNLSELSIEIDHLILKSIKREKAEHHQNNFGKEQS